MFKKTISLLILLVLLLDCFAPLGYSIDNQQAITNLKQIAAANYSETEIKQTEAITTNEPVKTKNIKKSSSINAPPDQEIANLSYLEKLFYNRIISENTMPKNINESIYKSKKIDEMNKDVSTDGEKVAVQTLDTAPKFLYQFGYDTFANSNLTNFEGTAPANDNYQLGPGDSIIIYMWGKIEKKIEVSLDRDGNIFIPEIGNLSLNKLRFKEAKTLIKNALASKYVNYNIDITLGSMKSIKLFVLGEVNKPGAYQLNSFSSAILGLYAANGPTKMGTLRNIRIVRNQKTILTLDLYKYLLSGNNFQDVILKDNDIIFVPAIGSVAAVRGMIKRPGIYELKGKTSLYDLMVFAGGLVSTSYFKLIQVERIKNGQNKIIFDLKYDSLSNFRENLKKVYLEDGDIVTVLPISEKMTNFVTVEGNVERPGNFQFRKGLTLGKLIQMADGVSAGTYLKRVEIYRYISDNDRKIISVDFTTSAGKNFLVSEKDLVKIYSISEVLGDQFVDIDGAVIKPGTYKLFKNMKIVDLAFLAQITKAAKIDKVEIYRQEVGKLPTIIDVNLFKAIQNPSSTNNVLLLSGDKISIRMGVDDSIIRKVTISGEVRFPGSYYLVENDHISDLIERAGGYTSRAYLFGTVFTRESIKIQEQSGELRVITQEQKRLLYDQSLANIQNKASIQDSIAYLTKQAEVNTGRLIINIEPLPEFKYSKDDLFLENGDNIYIPPIPSSVQLVGGVVNPNAISYVPGKDAGYYIDIAGGYSEYADRNRMFIIQANGNISRDLSKVSIGDVIYVPEAIKREIDWVDVIVKTSATIAQILTSFAVLKSIGIIK